MINKFWINLGIVSILVFIGIGLFNYTLVLEDSLVGSGIYDSSNSNWVVPEGTLTKCGEGNINTINGCMDYNEFLEKGELECEKE